MKKKDRFGGEKEIEQIGSVKVGFAGEPRKVGSFSEGESRHERASNVSAERIGAISFQTFGTNLMMSSTCQPGWISILAKTWGLKPWTAWSWPEIRLWTRLFSTPS